MRVLTYADKSQRFFPFMIESCKRHGYRVDVVGWGLEWKGWKGRMRVVLDEISRYDQDEIVAVVDSYDVLMLSSSELLERKFLEANTDLLISVDDQRPVNRVKTLLLFGSCGFQSVNAGTYVGRVHAIRKMLSYLFSIMTDDGDDQVEMVKYCDRHLSYDAHAISTSKSHSEIKLDIDQRVFFVCIKDSVLLNFTCTRGHPEGDLYLSLGHNGIESSSRDPRDSSREKRPSVLHCAANSDMTPILVCLGYLDSSSSTYRDLKREFMEERVARRRRERYKIVLYCAQFLAICLLVVYIAYFVRKSRSMRDRRK